MIAKFNGTCRVTGLPIIAGRTNIERVSGQWRVVDGTARATTDDAPPDGATMVMAWSCGDVGLDGDEYLLHYSGYTDDDGDCIGRTWRADTARSARAHADMLAARYSLPVEYDTIEDRVYA